MRAALAGLLLSGCWAHGPGSLGPGSQAGPLPLHTLSSELRTLAGRPYLVSVAEFDAREPQSPGPLKHYVVLSVHGDELSISWAASTGPWTATFAGDSISFGGHTLTATARPREFVADGRSVSLVPGATSVFWNGELAFVRSPRP